jgi:hypothetical protein
MFANVDLHLLPLTFLITNLLALAADREKCFENLNLGKQPRNLQLSLLRYFTNSITGIIKRAAKISGIPKRISLSIINCGV